MATDGRESQIQGIVFKKEKGDIKFLLLKRVPEKGNFWQSVTGGVKKGEEVLAALKREVEEEIGAKEIKNIVNTGYSFSFTMEDGEDIVEEVYGVEIEPSHEVIISEEHSEFKWTDLKEALNLLKYESNKKGFEILNNLIADKLVASLEDFKKLEIRIGKILTAERIEGSDKLLKLEVDFGTEKRQIVSGIAEFYSPEALINKEAPFVINLEPRKLRGVESFGMIMAASDNGRPVILIPEEEVPPGTIVK